MVDVVSVKPFGRQFDTITAAWRVGASRLFRDELTFKLFCPLYNHPPTSILHHPHLAGVR